MYSPSESEQISFFSSNEKIWYQFPSYEDEDEYSKNSAKTFLQKKTKGTEIKETLPNTNNDGGENDHKTHEYYINIANNENILDNNLNSNSFVICKEIVLEFYGIKKEKCEKREIEIQTDSPFKDEDDDDL